MEGEHEDQYQFEIMPELTEEEQAKIEQEHRERLQKFYSSTEKYAIGEWYHQLQQFTFTSYTFPLTNIEAYCLSVLYHDDEKLNQSQLLQQSCKRLQHKVDIFLKERFPSGCFMKLATRSPKDGGWDYRSPEAHLNQVNKLVNTLKGKITTIDKKAINLIYRFFLEESKQKVKVKSGKDFINIFSCSERVQIDINDLSYIRSNLFTQFAENNLKRANELFMNVWGRQWVDCSWMEQFRCFYRNYKLTAITQYDQRCFFPELSGKEPFIQSKICELFEKMKENLQLTGLSEGVADIIVKLDENSEAQLIQINIFDHNSRASLFNWQKDKEILENGPLQVRFHSTQIQISKWQLIKMMGMVEKGIEQVIKEAMKQLNLLEQWEKFE